jgi:hypothetical protein
MSTLVVDTLTGKSTAANLTIGSTPVVSSSANSLTIRGEGSNQTSIQQGLCKAWSHSGMDDNAIEDSFNTSGFADEGTGLANYSFTTNFGSANHVDVAMIGNNSAHVFYNGSNAKAAGSTGTLRNYDTGNNAADPPIINVTSHGDLA